MFPPLTPRRWRGESSSLSPQLLEDPAFSPIAAYLADNGPLQRFELATKIAEVFDHYTLFRPDMVTAWEQGEGGHWQARLWRALIDTTDEPHHARLQQSFFSAISGIADAALPQRVAVFGFSSLPPFFTSLFAALATRIPVRLFVLNPCAEYWDDIVSEREASRLAVRAAKKRGDSAVVTAPAETDLHLIRGIRCSRCSAGTAGTISPTCGTRTLKNTR